MSIDSEIFARINLPSHGGARLLLYFAATDLHSYCLEFASVLDYHRTGLLTGDGTNSLWNYKALVTDHVEVFLT